MHKSPRFFAEFDRRQLSELLGALDDLDREEQKIRQGDLSSSKARIRELEQLVQERPAEELLPTVLALREELNRLEGILTGQYREAARRSLTSNKAYERRELLRYLK